MMTLYMVSGITTFNNVGGGWVGGGGGLLLFAFALVLCHDSSATELKNTIPKHRNKHLLL